MGRRDHQNTPKPGSKRQEKLAARAAERAALSGPARPFEGVTGECDLVAMREFVPSATAKVQVDGIDRDLSIATVLPGAIAALVRDDSVGGEAFAAMQVQAVGSNDPGKDLAAALTWLRDASGGDTLMVAEPSDDQPALSELLGEGGQLEIETHSTFDWWIADETAVSPQIQQAVDNANQLMMQSARIDAEGVEAAWWVDAGDKAHIRWVRPENEDALFNALAKVHAAGGLTLGEGSRFAGSFRTNGLLVPVFDLDPEMHYQEWADGLVALDGRLSEALAAGSDLTSEERSSRDGLRARQVTLR